MAGSPKWPPQSATAITKIVSDLRMERRFLTETLWTAVRKLFAPKGDWNFHLDLGVEPSVSN